MKLVEAGFEADVQQPHVTRSGLHVNLGKDWQLKLRHLQPQKEIAARLHNEHWAFAYNLKNKDVECEYRTQVRPGELYIRQRIPNAQWELFPTPEVKLVTNPRLFGNGRVEHKASVSYDLLASRGRLEQSFDFDKKVKVKATADSSLGPLGAIIFNIAKPWAKSVSLEYGKTMGPLLTYHTEPSKQLLFDCAVSLQRKDLWASLQVAPKKDSKIKYTAEVTAKATSLSKSGLRLGARYTL